MVISDMDMVRSDMEGEEQVMSDMDMDLIWIW